jgi:phosphatidylserine decarboxylase
MRLDPAGLPFIGGALLVAVVAGTGVAWVLAIPFVALGAFFAFFFRDPDRVSPAEDEAVISPADGRVIHAGPALKESAPSGEWQQISIFLSPVDVHVNRIPVSGRVTRVNYIRGRFVPAYRHDAGSTNERSEIWIDHGGQTVVARQIVGILARRVVCRVKSGAEVQAGDRFGIMKFGSRMDVFVPPTATITVKVDESVRGGETVIAVLHSSAISRQP